MLARGVRPVSQKGPSAPTMFRRSFAVETNTNKILNAQTLPSKVLKAEYAVRGELVIRAELLTKKLAEKNHSFPFNEILYCNIGNPQSLSQPPITYFRQLLSLLQYPELIKTASGAFPKDVVERAQRTLQQIPGGLGAYSHSQGIPMVRKTVASFIERRDGYPADPDDIFLYNGASPGVQNSLKMLIRNEKDGIMIPTPQYPLYSASITLLGGSAVNYYLNEEKDWGLNRQELEKAYQQGLDKGLNPRALVVINPGNPTGQVLDVEGMKSVIEFCRDRKLVLLADEVYQENVYIKDTRPFTSFKKVLRSMGPHYNDFELISFHSVSKGFIGECGQRGGYLEAVGMDPLVKAELYKLSSVDLCPNTTGQLLIDVMLNPPKEGDESYPLYKKERDDIYQSLMRRAQRLTHFLDSQEGISCNSAQGAMYAFPQIYLPAKAIEAAQQAGMKADTFYAVKLLESTGVCVVPGSGFGQKEGTWHFRTTFLPPEDKIEAVLERLAKFQKEFLQQYK
eukprot:TRINITY_DN2487_c0_g1_i1.p1 TRINITY_DN2487_c0_g1~~TRINITY_DN2487_c0_g1_i1.p1  ORF type:complete len:509 (+),score=102.86 TRINITY_DN2487_c0_g1_i1:182-1708(+)